jgi:hypothetical protein
MTYAFSKCSNIFDRCDLQKKSHQALILANITKMAKKNYMVAVVLEISPSHSDIVALRPHKAYTQPHEHEKSVYSG